MMMNITYEILSFWFIKHRLIQTAKAGPLYIRCVTEWGLGQHKFPHKNVCFLSDWFMIFHHVKLHLALHMHSLLFS